MNKLQLRLPVLLLLALGPGSPVRGAMGLPFTVEDQDAQWRTVTLENEAAPGIVIEAVIVRPGGNSRFVVFRSTADGNSADGLMGFAGKIKAAILAGPSQNLTGNESAEIGFRGYDQQFDLVQKNEVMGCHLFVFTRDKIRWGVLYLAPKDTPALLPSPFAILRQKKPVAGDVVEMAPFRAQDSPVTGFPIGLAVTTNPLTGKVKKITVNDVPAGSTTERAGIRVGDQIVGIDHRKVQEFAVGIGQHSELGRIFLNRDPGDEVQLEVLTPHATRSWGVILQIPDARYFRSSPMP